MKKINLNVKFNLKRFYSFLNFMNSNKSFPTCKLFNPRQGLSEFRYCFYSNSKMNFSTNDNNSESSHTHKILDLIESQRTQLAKTYYSKESLSNYFNTISDCQFYFKNYIALKNSVENHFLKTLDEIIKKDKITEEIANVIIPQIIRGTLALEIKENTVLWDKLEKLLYDNTENLSK